MQWRLPCVFLVLTFSPCIESFKLINGSIRTTVRVFLENFGPSRPLYQPTQADKDWMRSMFDSHVGASLMRTLQDKMERYTLTGMGQTKPVQISCPVNVQITSCKAAFLHGLSAFTQESEFTFKDEGRYLISYMVINFRTIMSESYIQYTTQGLIHNDIRGIYYFQPYDPQIVRVQVMLKRKFYLWFIPAYCFVYISKINYKAIQGDVDTTLERNVYRHYSRGKGTMRRHPMINNIMEHHMRAAIPPAVILAIDNILDDYRKNSYVCKY